MANTRNNSLCDARERGPLTLLSVVSVLSPLTHNSQAKSAEHLHITALTSSGCLRTPPSSLAYIERCSRFLFERALNNAKQTTLNPPHFLTSNRMPRPLTAQDNDNSLKKQCSLASMVDNRYARALSVSSLYCARLCTTHDPPAAARYVSNRLLQRLDSDITGCFQVLVSLAVNTSVGTVRRS